MQTFFFIYLTVGALSAVTTGPSNVYIGGLFTMFQGPPAYSFSAIGSEFLAAMIFAMDEINNKTDGIADDLLPFTKLGLVYRNDRYDGVSAMKASIDLLSNSVCNSTSASDCSGVLAVVGPLTSTATINVQYVAAQLNTPQISGTAVSAQLTGSALYPTFLRTIPSDYGATSALAGLINSLGWTCATTIGATDDYSTSGVGSFIKEASKFGIKIVTSVTILAQDTDISLHIRTLKNAKCPLIVAWALNDDLVKIFAAAYQEKFYGKGIQWIISSTFLTSGTIDKLVSAITVQGSSSILKGTLTLQASYGQGTPYYNDAVARWITRKPTVGVNGSCRNDTDNDPKSPTFLYKDDHDFDPSTPMLCGGSTFKKDNFVNWAVYIYDAVHVVARAIHRFIYEKGIPPCPRTQFQTKSTSNLTTCFRGTDLFQSMVQSSIQGISGNISFTPGTGDRAVDGSLYFVLSHDGGIVSDKLKGYQQVGTLLSGSLVGCSSSATDCFTMVWPSGETGFSNKPIIGLPVDNSGGGSTDTKFLAWVIVVIIVGVFLIIAAVLLISYYYWKYHERRRILQSVPKGDNIAILFTDIQSSTLLWSTYPDEMKVALHLHNTIIRKAISDYNGYEVKTIGDSFMVIFHTCKDAMRFCTRVQNELLVAEWPAKILNDNNCAEIKGVNGKKIWCGLRVRIGMTTGNADLEYDPRTFKVDYFGPNVNLAARVEGAAYGGQVLTTEKVYFQVKDSLSENERNSFRHVGEHTFKGVVGYQNVYEFISVEGREFGEVRNVVDATPGANDEGLCGKCLRPCTFCVRNKSSKRDFKIKPYQSYRDSSPSSSVVSV